MLVRGWTLVVLTFLACGPLGFEMPDGVETAVPGAYEGTMHFDARAKLGPVRVKHESCDVDVAVLYDPAMSPPIQGIAACALESLGDVQVYFSGDILEMPFVGGDVEASVVTGTWDGWFVDEDSLHGESTGKVPYEHGLTIVYEATFDVDLADPTTESW